MCLVGPLEETPAWLFPLLIQSTHRLSLLESLHFSRQSFGTEFTSACMIPTGHILSVKSNDHWNIPPWMGVLDFSNHSSLLFLLPYTWLFLRFSGTIRHQITEAPSAVACHVSIWDLFPAWDKDTSHYPCWWGKVELRELCQWMNKLINEIK